MSEPRWHLSPKRTRHYDDGAVDTPNPLVERFLAEAKATVAKEERKRARQKRLLWVGSVLIFSAVVLLSWEQALAIGALVAMIGALAFLVHLTSDSGSGGGPLDFGNG